MLELRPGCEYCDVDLSPDSTEARICSFECTFCARCADGVLASLPVEAVGKMCKDLRLDDKRDWKGPPASLIPISDTTAAASLTPAPKREILNVRLH